MINKYTILVVLLLLLVSCNGTPTKEVTASNDSIAKDPFQVTTADEGMNLQFLGHKIQCTEEELPREFARICAEDENLSFDSIQQNITIYGTTFHLNCQKQGFVLMSSVQPDSKQMKVVRDAISKFHGKENLEEDEHYSWVPYADSTKTDQNYPVIHLRRVHSDEGGTVILVN